MTDILRYRDDDAPMEPVVTISSFADQSNSSAVLIEAGDDVRDLLPHLDRLKLAVVDFPRFRDGRGYSSARILREAGPTLLAFLVGGVGTVIGTVVAFQVVPLGPEGWKLAAIFAATYIGGSMNYAAAAEAVGLRSGDLLSAGVAARGR